MITKRKLLKRGMLVEIKIANEIHRGYIKNILSKTDSEKGILVELQSGKKGRVLSLVSKKELDREQKIKLNKFLSNNIVYSIWDNKKRSFVLFHIFKANTVFLFSNKKDAQHFLNKINSKTNTNINNININQLNNNKMIFQNLEHLIPEYIIIDEVLRIKFKDFKDKEQFFNKL